MASSERLHRTIENSKFITVRLGVLCGNFMLEAMHGIFFMRLEYGINGNSPCQPNGLTIALCLSFPEAINNQLRSSEETSPGDVMNIFQPNLLHFTSFFLHTKIEIDDRYQ